MVQFLEGRNRAWAQLDAPINGSDTNVALASGEGSRLSDVTTASGRKVRAQIYERDAETGAITKCELVDITNNVSDVLIIERAVESTRATDTTNTYAATPQSFTANAIIEEVITSEVLSEIQDEVNRLETDKLDKSVYDAERVVYAASSAGDDDYEILTGDSLATVADGRIFAVRADVANTGASTLKVDATSPVALKKLSGGAFADLVTGDIIANQIFFAMKNTAAACYQFSLDPATLALTVADADETTKGIVERATDTEARAGTDIQRYITPAQLAMMKVNYQIKFPVENETYIDTFTGSDQLQACPDYIYTAYSTTGTNTRIHRYDRQTNGSYVYRGTIANITVASGSCCGITVIGSYVYVGQHDGGAGGIRVYRLALDLTGSTLMTGTMAMTNSTNRTCMTGDGTDLFFTDYNGSFQVATVKRYTISGTTLSLGSTITLSVVGTNDSHYLYKFPSGGIYVIPRGATVSSIAYWNNAGTAQTAITCLLSTYTANIEQAMGFFKYAGTACFARMRKNDGTSSSDILLQPIDLV